ncbi:MAG: hypothetical protein ACXVH6_03335 [Halobacteriota archaeon]
MRWQRSRASAFCAIIVGALLLGGTGRADSDEPFGLPTAVAPTGSLWIVWRQLESELLLDELIVAQCRANLETCTSPAALRFIAIVNEARQYEGDARIAHINRAINLAIRWKEGDEKWSSPLAALASGVGDCKSYAVTKYAALGDVGIGGG